MGRLAFHWFHGGFTRTFLYLGVRKTMFPLNFSLTQSIAFTHNMFCYLVVTNWFIHDTTLSKFLVGTAGFLLSDASMVEKKMNGPNLQVLGSCWEIASCKQHQTNE